MAGWASASFAQPADSLSAYEDLKEIVVKSERPRKVIKREADGGVVLDRKYLGEQPSFMGGGDAVAVLRSLPSVATNNDLQATMIVRGGASGSTLFETDGIRIINPMHMLGLYSAFNPSFYNGYVFRDGYTTATTSNHGGSYLLAFNPLRPDTCLSGSVSVGLIESHGAIHIPLIKGKSSLSVGVRQSYLNLIFPNILKLGKSVIKYDFTDFNVGFTNIFSETDTLRLNLFANRDAMKLHSSMNGEKSGDFRWRNISAGVEWKHRRLATVFSFTNLNNQFEMEEGDRDIVLPTYFSQFAAKSVYTSGNFSYESDIIYRRSSLQRNKSLVAEGAKCLTDDSFEWNVAADWRKTLMSRLTLDIGMRLSYYRNDYNGVTPMPRISAVCKVADGLNISASYGRFTRFDRQIMESNAGLPTDFWISSSRKIRPEDVHSLELGVSGILRPLSMDYSLTGYYKIIRNVGEFTGSFLNFTSASYNPLDDYVTGRGYAAGVSANIARQVGKVRGRIAYNFGVSRARFEKFGTKYIPTSYDRPHDFNATLNYSPVAPLTLSASYIYATGTPYTRAKYGYMIGENLICEYFPHNSSRLPDYKRLDLSATWTIKGKSRIRHHINVSVYNALANRNVLFIFTRYSLDNGISQERSEMKAVIPSVSYSVEF